MSEIVNDNRGKALVECMAELAIAALADTHASSACCSIPPVTVNYAKKGQFEVRKQTSVELWVLMLAFTGSLRPQDLRRRIQVSQKSRHLRLRCVWYDCAGFSG